MANIHASLKRIKEAREQGAKLEDDDPFYLHDGLLVGRPGVADDEVIEEVFALMVDPEPHPDVIESIHKVRATPGEPRPDVGVFTYGMPNFQLTKILRLMERAAAEGKPLPFASILLTTVSKGDFMTALIQDASRNGEHVDPYFNTAAEHVIVLADDNPKQLNEYEEVNRLALQYSEGGVVGVRLRHDPNAKAAKRDWSDIPDRTQRATRYTYDGNGITQSVEELVPSSAQRLADIILMTIIRGSIKPHERPQFGHYSYDDDMGSAPLVARDYGNRPIIKMFPKGAQGDFLHVYRQWEAKNEKVSL